MSFIVPVLDHRLAPIGLGSDIVLIHSIQLVEQCCYYLGVALGRLVAGRNANRNPQ
jgi:hypothetical protein